jgi:hypothetical protein
VKNNLKQRGPAQAQTPVQGREEKGEWVRGKEMSLNLMLHYRLFFSVFFHEANRKRGTQMPFQLFTKNITEYQGTLLQSQLLGKLGQKDSLGHLVELCLKIK